ncbi:hypothetical protein IWX47DRAFT_841095 [Phyllosticta citricarpa]
MKEEGMMDDEVDNVCDVRAATTFMFDGGSPTGGGERRPKQPRRSCPSTTLDDIVLPLLFPSLLDPAAAEWIAHWTTSSPIGRDLGPDADVKAVLLTTTLETALERFYLLPPKPMARRNRNDPEHTSELDSSQLSVDPLFADDTVFQAAMTPLCNDRRATETTPGISNGMGSNDNCWWIWVLRGYSDWVHDRFEDDDSAATAPNDFPAVALMPKGRRSNPPHKRLVVDPGQRIWLQDTGGESALRIDRGRHLRMSATPHFDIFPDSLQELFERIGPVENARLMYDRHDRSEGVAFVTYRSLADARVACREYDGANAHGQPIRLTLVPPGPAPRRNPSDTAQRPSRSLFERIETRDRSLSPDRVRRSDVTKPPPAGIDRYVPGEDSGRRRSPPPPRRRGGGRESGRRPGERRTGGRGGRRADDDGRPVVQGRPRKTQDELDAEMEDYWGVGHDGAADAPVNGSGDVQSGPADPGAAANNAINDDIEMEVE